MDDGEDVLRVEVSGEDGSFVDMTRFIHLPNSERRRLEADRDDTKARIAEIAFEPTTGEWYYLTMVRTVTSLSLFHQVPWLKLFFPFSKMNRDLTKLLQTTSPRFWEHFWS